MAEASSSHESVNSSDEDHGFVYHRSRGRTRKEDSWLRRERRKIRGKGNRSPESEERRSLSPYTCVTKGYTKPKKQKKKKKSKKTGSETPASSTDSIAVHASDSNKDECPTAVPIQSLENMTLN